MKRLRKPFSIIAGVALLVSPALPTSARAQAQPITLYAYAGAPTSALRTCPLTSAPGLQCSLGKALSLAVGGDVIALATPNGRGDYVGNWDVDTKGTSSRAPLTIEQAPNMIASPLDGNDGRRAGCGTAACDGPVLDVGGDVFFSLLDVEVDDADDTTTYGGGAVQNSQGGSVTVSGSVFYYDTAGAGGAIDNGDQGGHGSLYVTASSFIGDSARGGQVEDGGAIDNGDNGGHGTAYVGGSTFMDDSAASDGGAIDNGDGTGVRPGAGALKVTTSTFMGNQAGQNGGAIDSDDVAVIPNSANWAAKPSTLRVSLSTFWDNSARFWGGAIGSGESPLGSGPGSTVVGQSSLAANTALFGGDLYGDNSVTVGGDLLADGCSATNGTARTSWSDAGYNVGENATCFAKGRGDISQVQLPRFIGRPAPNGGTTETLMPLAGSAAVGAVPYATTVDLAGTDVALCPTKDQRGIASSPGQPCDSGAVQLGGGAPAAPGPTATLYAYAGATGAGLPSCPPTSDKARRCDLGEAVSSALPGDIVALAGPGKDPRYTGNWTISTPLTTAQSPITIEPAPGTGRPVLDGNDGRRRGCTTTLCDGPVLQVGYREYLVIRGVSVQDAANLVTGQGGAIDNLGGTVAIDGSSFSHDDAAMGGAIDNADCWVGSLTIANSSFRSDGATWGGAIDNGDGEGKGASNYACSQAIGNLSVTRTSFMGNVARGLAPGRGGDGGAVDNGDRGGVGLLTVSRSKFTDNSATGNGGAVDNGDGDGQGAFSVSHSSFLANTAREDGGALYDGGNPGSPTAASIMSSTFANNKAVENGGALDDAGTPANRADNPVMITWSTFSVNAAGHDGGAIENDGGGGMAARNSTFVGNAAASQGATINNKSSWAFLADILSGTCSGGGSWHDGGYNVTGGSYCREDVIHDVVQTGLAHVLGPLAANGGPTETVLPLRGNHALGNVPYGAKADFAGEAVTLCPATDQRGVVTPPRRACDSGSVQVIAVPTARASGG